MGMPGRPKGRISREDKKKFLESVDGDGLKAALEKKGFDPDPEGCDVVAISKEAWGQSLTLQDARKRQMDRGQKSGWSGMTLREKQQAILEFNSGIISNMAFQVRYTQWCLEHPGDAMRLYYSTIPKEAQITVSHEGNVVLLPAKMRSVQDWLTETKDNPDGDAVDVVPE